MGLLKGQRGLVFGIANDRSIACHIAKCFQDEGATCAFPYLPGDKNERRVAKALEEIGATDPWLLPCDVCKDEDIDATFAAAKEKYDSIDFVIHSVAYADRAYLKPGMFNETPRDTFAQAMDISAYSLVAVARRAKTMMPRGGSVLALTYNGSQRAVPGYNVMGVAKAALEASVRYLALELGEQGIRVNAISAGALRTLSSMAVGGIDEIFDWVSEKSPLHRNITTEEVGKAAVYLTSDLASGVTGENMFVDAGYNTVGM